EVKTGIHLCASVQEVVDGYYAVETPVSPFHSPFALALPAFDEYTIGYKNHDAILRDGERPKMEIYNNVIIIDGQAVGNWRRTLTKGAVVIETTLYRPLSSAEQEAFAAEVQRYGDFLQMPIILK
ncbi:MAG: winged helix DNA-binding domain-containing protein, partial [Anaerolineae bacterium]|nr:winged helix DNA-binding domain-containing protein [Anaerolineae bacterium]